MFPRNTYPNFTRKDGNSTEIPGKDIFCDFENYNGPPIEDLSYNFGYGSFSGGHMDATLGDKTFGTLGQGTELQDYIYGGGVTDTWTPGMFPTYKYLATTFLPLIDNTDLDKESMVRAHYTSRWLDWPDGTTGNWTCFNDQRMEENKYENTTIREDENELIEAEGYFMAIVDGVLGWFKC